MSNHKKITKRARRKPRKSLVETLFNDLFLTFEKGASKLVKKALKKIFGY